MKTCFRCQLSLPETEFYKHPRMADGLLGKCKTCAKKDSLTHRWKNIDEVRKYDRKRDDLPHRVAARIAYQQTERGRILANKAKRKYTLSDSRKTAARILFGNARRDGKISVPETCSKCANLRPQGHHENYDKPLEVVWLCSGCHAARHKEMRRLGIKP